MNETAMKDLKELIGALEAESVERIDYHYPPGELGIKSVTVEFSHLIYLTTKDGVRPDVITEQGCETKPKQAKHGV